MRLLVLIPIIHSEQDLGSFSNPIRKASVREHGLAKTEQHQAAIRDLWSAIHQLVYRLLEGLALPYQRLRLYQDGLPDSGHQAEIVREVASQGSQNHQLLLELMQKGAQLMGTESPGLLIREYELLRSSEGARMKSDPTGVNADAGRQLLAERDRYIAQRINDTLRPDEVGLLFLGLAHSIEPLLQQDIQVKSLLLPPGSIPQRQPEICNG